jgi:hypothetical protein
MVDAQNTHNIDGRLLDERIHDNIHSISSLAARAPHMIHGIHTSSRTQVVVKDRPSPTGRSLSLAPYQEYIQVGMCIDSWPQWSVPVLATC